jgi:long-chain acyl-CoA synthetase
LRSGDIGRIDEDGFLFITDRKKDVIVTAGGKNVAPQYVENELKASKYVSQALVVGDRRPYVVALLTLEPAEIGKWATANGLGTDPGALAADGRVRELLDRHVRAVNADLARFEQIKRFAILPRDFTQEDGEVTPTLKLRRRVCEQHFAAEIEELYA